MPRGHIWFLGKSKVIRHIYSCRKPKHHHQSIMSQKIITQESSISLVGYYILIQGCSGHQCLVTGVLNLWVIHPAGAAHPLHCIHAQHSACPAFCKWATNTCGMSTWLRRQYGGERESCSDKDTGLPNPYFQALQARELSIQENSFYRGLEQTLTYAWASGA